MKNLEQFGVQEMDSLEVVSVDGGGWIKQALKKCGPIGTAAFYIWDNWDEIEEGWNSYEPQHM